MNRLELKVPPLIVALIVSGLMLVASMATPPLAVPAAYRAAAAVVLLATALALIASAVIAFRHVGTTIDPTDPERSRALVTTGVYRLTRNPMYLAMLLALVAFGLWLGSPLALGAPALFIAYMNRFQIGPEERALAARFREDYGTYRARVRRWV